MHFSQMHENRGVGQDLRHVNEGVILENCCNLGRVHGK